jgi:hypothetical protein
MIDEVSKWFRILDVRQRTAALYQEFTQRRMVVSYRFFGISYLSHSQGTVWPLDIGWKGYPETSGRHCHSTLREILTDGRSHSQVAGYPKSHRY